MTNRPYGTIYEGVTSNLAIQREKNIKRWPRAWKIALAETDNPNWDDLSARAF